MLEFFRQHADIDVFCLQEVWNGGEEVLKLKAAGAELAGVVTDLLSKITEALPDHQAFFHPQLKDFFGLAIFVRKKYVVTEHSAIPVYQEPGYVNPEELADHTRYLQYVKIACAADSLLVTNTHGLWIPEGKRDTAERLIQSDKIAAFVKAHDGSAVVAGDFNLRPDIESVERLEKSGLRNLVTEHGITSTRTSRYTKEEKFADYIFVSDGIEVKDFKVMPDEVSDHAALCIEFE